MSRKSSIDRLPPAVRTHLQRRLREGQLTLDELIADLRQRFPDQTCELPSRSAVHRYSQGVEEIVAHEREMAVAANALVAELGEEFDSKSGALLAQAVTTLAGRTAMGMVKAGAALEISDVLDLARAAKAAQEARSLNLRERQAVAKAAREKLLEEMQARAATLTGKPGVSDETRQEIRRVLGIE
ncbi:hypothetical protein AGMMS50225_06780 [Betaproteobacteria bacterium]|nr:hypothetical protein AGMMS50225_06780 [Betaproteobacteria bacterium]